MSYIKPKKLMKGNLIGIISPASSPDDLSLIQNGVNYIERLGYRTILGNNVGKSKGYLAGSDEDRISDLHQMFSNKNVKAILCLRGGYGAFRLLDKINYQLIRHNPKIFVGFSEITALQMAFLRKANLITFAGPMVIPNFSREVSIYTEENFWGLLSSNKKRGKIVLAEKNNLKTVIKGRAEGNIVGGNLAVFISLLGTKYLPDLKNKILLVEDISEPPYKIDRMLNQLRLNKVFKNIKGIILGSFIDCVEADKKKKTLTLDEVLHNYLGDLMIPVFKNFPHGHIKDFITVPFGINVKLNASQNSIEFTEGAVR
jgi:muramoyltetrapeptide carboxypeptidase